MTIDQRNRVLALNLAGGTAYCAVVEVPDQLVAGELERIELAEGLEPAEQLADFAARVRQELTRLEPLAVGVEEEFRLSPAFATEARGIWGLAALALAPTVTP